jgi:hypothetical protein
MLNHYAWGSQPMTFGFLSKVYIVHPILLQGVSMKVVITQDVTLIGLVK